MMMKMKSVRMLVLAALLAALQVVLSKFLMVQISQSIRFSIDSTPILLAGLWFGPLAGALVGAASDALGTILFPTGGPWFPPLTIAFAFLGATAGLFRRYAAKKCTLPRAALAVCVSEAAGSLLFKSYALSMLTGFPFLTQLGMRAVPVAVNAILNTLLVFALYRLLTARVHAGERTKVNAAPRPAGMTYDEALSFIHSVQWRGSRLGLSRTNELLALCGNPERSLSFIHVAGTNGKGSTCAMLASVLTAAGYRTGLYISPFINRFNERMQIDGVPIPDETLAEITSFVRPQAESMADHPTEFELITAIALLYYAREQCDYVVLEVGLGGALDSTNAIPVPKVAVITNIGLDHTRELGPAMADVARAKAGIIKPGGNVVFYGDNPEAEAVIRKACEENDARLRIADFSRITNVRARLEALTFDFAPWTELSCPLTGTYQLKNAAVALTVLETLRENGCSVPDKAVYAGLANVRWPARFEVLRRDPLFIVDGGHNPQGVRAAVDSIRLHFPDRKVVFLLGIMADKDIPHMLPIICEVAERFVTVTPRNPRALPADELARRLHACGFDADPCDTVESGVDAALELAAPDGIAFALGSLYMLGDIRAYLQRSPTP